MSKITRIYKGWYINYGPNGVDSMVAPNGTVIKPKGRPTGIAAKRAITKLIKAGTYELSNTTITKSKPVNCPLYGSTHCGVISKADALKTGYLPTGSGNDHKLSPQELTRIERLADDAGECDISELPAVRLTYANGDTSVSSVSRQTTLKSATDYFVGSTFDRGSGYDETTCEPIEDMQLCTSIEFIN